jgi:hypothetical protein
MSKYFDWRIDSDKSMNNLLWLRENADGSIKVVLETAGIWKLSRDEWQKLNESPYSNTILNNQDDVTTRCLGIAAIKAWKANGSPSKESQTPPKKEYLMDIFMAPLSVKAHLHHGIDGCPTVEELVALGVQIAK